ncbi:MAG TPA: flagellar basal body P-ring formation chaperone FlgA [Pseudomonas sp.]|nr:flagellar basal body P-ring formation chaperone FlgA [Pseudomonas sp.]
MTACRQLLRSILVIGWAAIAGPTFASDCVTSAAPPQALLQQVSAQLRQAFNADGLRLELEPVGELPAMTQPSIRLLGRGLRSRVAVELAGEVCGRAQVATAWFKLRAFQDAWVYGRNTKAGGFVENAGLRREQVDLAGAQVAVADLAREPQGLWLVQDVRAGMPVLNRHLQPEPLVKRDEMVRVVVHGPGLLVSTQGKAMRPGMLGEKVPVLLDGADSSLLAVVAGKGEVHVGQQ